MYRTGKGGLVPVMHKLRGDIGSLGGFEPRHRSELELIFVRQARVELVCLRAIRRRLRVSLKRFRRRSKSRRLWLTVAASFPLSFASKASRMGKGRGLFER